MPNDKRNFARRMMSAERELAFVARLNGDKSMHGAAKRGINASQRVRGRSEREEAEAAVFRWRRLTQNEVPVMYYLVIEEQ